MTKKYKVKYLPLFYKDLDNITDYIKNKLNNEIAANNFLNKVEKIIKQRLLNPYSYEKFISTKKRKHTYYRIYINNYTIFYTINTDTVEIRRILYSKRNFNKLIS